MAIIDKTMPALFRLLSFSLKKISAIITDRTTIPILLMPKTIELSKIPLSSAIIIPYSEKKLTIPRRAPAIIV